MSNKHAITFLAIGLTSLALSLFIAMLYFVNFWAPEFSDNVQTWGAFGDYFGGTASAIFSLISLLAILSTTAIQINIANKTASEAHSELEKQASAMSDSSRMEVMSFLHSYYNTELTYLQQQSPKPGTTKYNRLIEIQSRIDQIKLAADSSYAAIFKK